jgi:hypothetical protein
MSKERFAGKFMQDLGPGRLHSRAFSGGQDDYI